MKVNTNAIEELLSPLRQYFQKDNFTREDVNDKPPLRSELFTTDQMEQHARHLAGLHEVSHEHAPEQLLKRLAENEEILERVTALLQETTREKKVITPAGEWLLDNFYLIEEQVRIGKLYLPKGYSKGLPKLRSGSQAGYPRVYDIATEIISHSDGHVDINSLSRFISAYQKARVLTIGELWAIPIMLRLALLENLRRVAARIAVDRIDAELADHWATRIIRISERKPRELVLAIADMARSNPPMVSAFVAEIARKLQWKGLDMTLALNWIEQNLSGTGHNINSMVLAENQKQAADQLSVSNSINSLRFLSKIDWREFVETMSVVDQVLREDEVYSKMDFQARDCYRHEVERMAKDSLLPEHEVAKLVAGLARENSKKAGSRESHIGFYLIGKGLTEAERVSGANKAGRRILETFFKRGRNLFYSAPVFILTIVVAALFFSKARAGGVPGWILALATTLAVFAGLHLALGIVNWIATLWVKPKPLPKMDFSTGIPPESRTLVVVPSIISSESEVDQLVRDLEVRFLANRDPNLLFGLLTDFQDAAAETMPDDDQVLSHAEKEINELNTRYGRSSADTFFLFHRPRRYNRHDRIWMGYERKRGKLSDLNQLLRGKAMDRFSRVVGDERVYTTVKYVVTLDADTQLPRDMAWKLVGVMSHPLNKPHYDRYKKRITEGYGIIQPRMAISLHGATRSRYSRLNENDSGIDPYTRVTSDVYQDLFGEGSFIGKGIYDVDAFELALDDCLPENRILSHDLLEGCFARCGFASDIQCYEEYPSRYVADIARRHRWMRGDWQIATWIFPYAPGGHGRLRRNRLGGLSRWKIFDNLRRSVTPIALTCLMILGWTSLGSPWFWTLWMLAILFVPPLLASLWQAGRKPREIALGQHLNNAVGTTHKNILQALLNMACLPYESYIHADAILRTLWRTTVSRRKLLEWNRFELSKEKKHGLPAMHLKMAIAPLLASACFAYLTILAPPGLLWALPILTLWLFSPTVAWWISKPIPQHQARLSARQRLHLRKLSRKTWSFFETLVGPDDHWLPPDNLQQYPIPVIAHRTSPTNIGLSALSNLAALDFGYLTTQSLIDRTSRTFASLEQLERYKGHFFNWYDTQTLKVLSPRYISTVDSGNLAGHLLTLRQGLLGIPNQSIISLRAIEGLQDTLGVISGVVSKTERPAIETFREFLDATVNAASGSLEGVKVLLEHVQHEYAERISPQKFDPLSEAGWWVHSFDRQVKGWLDEIGLLAPWLTSGPVQEKFKDLHGIDQVPVLAQIPALVEDLTMELIHRKKQDLTRDEKTWVADLEVALHRSAAEASRRVSALRNLADQAFGFANAEYDFLYDKSQRLLSIGYLVDDRHRDAIFYDLLASEARLSVFVAIAQGKIPQESWFALGRRLTTAGDRSVLLSWSGSMFEYLMPMLVMPNYENTLLDESCKGAVEEQIAFGQQKRVPWGVSESCYNVVDGNLIFQYRAFGIPGLGFKRGLGQDLVIAPYSTVMALMINPERAYQNIEKLISDGNEGRFGFFEAVDYTPSRLSRGQRKAQIQTFMAHHQGMSLLSLEYILLDRPMQKRFESDSQFQTALLLLQEQVPRTTGYFTATVDTEDTSLVSSGSDVRVVHTAQTATPEIQLLSNGRYHVMITNAGGGYSRWKDLAVTRWHEDTTRDNWGTFCFIRDTADDKFWSTTYQPSHRETQHYDVIFSQGRAEFRRRDHKMETHTEIIVSPEDDIEVRRVHLTNHSRNRRVLEVTSYSEVVIAAPQADWTHPAFSNLFVQTKILSGQHAILCTRRPRSKEEAPPWLFHLMKVDGAPTLEVSYETDRSKFIGRGSSVSEPQAMRDRGRLSGSEGPVLDPIVAIRYLITIEPGESAIVDMITGIAPTREANQLLVDKYQDRHLRDRAFELSWTHSQVVLRQIGATEPDAQLFSHLAGSIIYANPFLRADPGVIAKNQRGQPALWSYSISGDLPIALLQVADSSNINLVRQMIKAQAYWNLKGLDVDLVILNEDPSGYRQQLLDHINGLVAAGIGSNPSERKGRIFVRPLEQVSTEDLVLLQTVARIVIADKRGTLADQVNKRSPLKSLIPLFHAVEVHEPTRAKSPAVPELAFFNGMGGFTQDGKEYVIILDKGSTTPLPWTNVIANEAFGTLVSESGSSYTWSENAHEYRLTPWSNDPVTDHSGEALYIRDEKSGHSWSPAPWPVRASGRYTVRHGFGQTRIECIEDGIFSSLAIYVDPVEAIKFMTLRLQNQSGRRRFLSVTGYVEWVLGGLRPGSLMHIVTESDPASGAIFARNPYHTEFYDRVAFFGVDARPSSFTADRAEFIGRNSSLQDPEALRRTRLSGKIGAGLDPCAALQVTVTLEKGQKTEIIFRLGAGKDMTDALELNRRFEVGAEAIQAMDRVRASWTATLESVQVETPDQSINILANGWLVYQVLSCRLWGRSGFYQSGGAFGFRDQLQDVLALLHVKPKLAKDQILLSASRQFLEGDVQHWWHPPLGRGVRTLCSDDLLWLPYVTSRYIEATGDMEILDEKVPFLQGRLLNAHEESYYDLPIASDDGASLYEHCKRAIQRSLRFGEHGLPLMGSGDWNDGMNMVGVQGTGESVWLGFFLCDVLRRFVAVAEHRHDALSAQSYRQHAELLKGKIDEHAWDGDWYLRAFFDDGRPLGSARNAECSIDSIAQSWSVLSEAGDPERSRIALKSAYRYLVSEKERLIKLLHPPFDATEMDPGYIKGYVPGVRENGGQYTHAAIWLIMAFAKLGDRAKTSELLQLINPIHHGDSVDGIATYKSEPYVVAADVYGVEPHTGRGGWTWYTGSAGWMYQLVMESFLGVRRHGANLVLEPCVPQDWKSFHLRYEFGESTYHIEMRLGPAEGDLTVTIDGERTQGKAIPLLDDGREHHVQIRYRSRKPSDTIVR